MLFFLAMAPTDPLQIGQQKQQLDHAIQYGFETQILNFVREGIELDATSLKYAKKFEHNQNKFLILLLCLIRNTTQVPEELLQICWEFFHIELEHMLHTIAKYKWHANDCPQRRVFIGYKYIPIVEISPPPLFLAETREEVLSLIRLGENPNFIFNNKTPLSSAIHKNRPSVVETLLENHGYDKILDNPGIISQFLSEKKFTIIKVLMQKNIGITYFDPLNFGLFVRILENRQFDLWPILMQHVAQINTQTRINELLKDLLYYFVNQDDIDSVKFLVRNGADPCMKDSADKTIFHRLVRQKNKDGSTLGRVENNTTQKFLLECGVNINTPDKDGFTPLHLAAYHGINDKSLLQLFEYGADFNILDHEGNTALHIAALHNKSEVIHAFCKLRKNRRFKINFFAENNYGQTARDIAKRLKFPDCCAILTNSMKEEILKNRPNKLNHNTTILFKRIKNSVSGSV